LKNKPPSDIKIKGKKKAQGLTTGRGARKWGKKYCEAGGARPKVKGNRQSKKPKKGNSVQGKMKGKKNPRQADAQTWKAWENYEGGPHRETDSAKAPKPT